MITKWKLSNFKSVRNLTELPLGQLTILAGSNSSGKSTLLQSMLLISQTMISRVSSRSVVLNGSIIKLGQFDDLRSYESDVNQILIGWEMEPRNNEVIIGRSFSSNRLSYRYGGDIRKIDCELSFDADAQGMFDDILQLQPRLFSNYMKWTSAEESGESSHYISINRVEDRIKKIETNSIKTDNEAFLQAMDYDVDIDLESQRGIRRWESPSPVLLGLHLRHFLPTRLLFSYNETERIAKIIASVICGREDMRSSYDLYRIREMEKGEQIEIPASVIELLRDNLGDSAGTIFETESNSLLQLKEFTERLAKLDKPQAKDVNQKLKKNKNLSDEIINTVLADLGENRKIRFSRSTPDLNEVTQYIEEFFSSSIKYLGPLRDEPRPLYPLATSNDPIDIGIKGEHTAAVFDLNKDRTVSYISTDGFRASSIQPKVSSRPLKTAIIEWLEYLDVAVDVLTHDLGKIGHELKVMTNGTSKGQDLTHVGVGVSQVLPILVMCLLADQDSTIIIEQPELHLHPKVQTRLADFFLSMSMLGKQCIIETHSEYIVNRLRFRAAAAQADAVSSLMKIYFVDKKHGCSVFNPVEVNKYGAITDWPDGFFDQSQSEAEEILRAATLKRKAEKGK